jgi:hypothetical protein
MRGLVEVLLLHFTPYNNQAAALSTRSHAAILPSDTGHRSAPPSKLRIYTASTPFSSSRYFQPEPLANDTRKDHSLCYHHRPSSVQPQPRRPHREVLRHLLSLLGLKSSTGDPLSEPPPSSTPPPSSSQLLGHHVKRPSVLYTKLGSPWSVLAPRLLPHRPLADRIWSGDHWRLHAGEIPCFTHEPSPLSRAGLAASMFPAQRQCHLSISKFSLKF